jgi:hypothetical protein
MPFDWQEFLHLAERLLQCDSEAAFRSAISRAYYSVFNAAFERAQKNNCLKFDPANKTGMHVRCWALYRKGPDQSCINVGIEGDRLREARVRADYKSGPYLRLKEQATQSIKDVKALQARLAALHPKYPFR